MIDLCLRLESRSVLLGKRSGRGPKENGTSSLARMYGEKTVVGRRMSPRVEFPLGPDVSPAFRFPCFLSEVETRVIGIGWNGEPSGLLAVGREKLPR